MVESEIKIGIKKQIILKNARKEKDSTDLLKLTIGGYEFEIQIKRRKRC